jgi:hypothetical protein
MSVFKLQVEMKSAPSQEQIQEAIKILLKHENFPIVEMVEVNGVWTEKMTAESNGYTSVS